MPQRLLLPALLWLLSLWILFRLPYSSSQFSRWSNLDRSWPASPAPLNLPEFQRLQPAFSGLSPLAAAEELAREFARRFPHGEPESEFPRVDYQPALDLKQHWEEGSPGHCVTRSALLATSLLAAHIPARVVQLIPHEGPGHNCLEVFEAGRGWILVDPTYMVVPLDGTRRPLGAAALKNCRGFRKLGTAPIAAPPGTFYASLAPGYARVYPEPWLYTRCGRSQALWPHRGLYYVPFRDFLQVGLPQRTCKLLILLGFGWLCYEMARLHPGHSPD